jgi:hypothetical protein
MNRRPAVEKYLAIVDFVPILNFLFPNLRRKLRIPAETIQIRSLDTQRHACRAVDPVCIGVEPGLLRELIAARAGKPVQLERGLYRLLDHKYLPLNDSDAADSSELANPDVK